MTEVEITNQMFPEMHESLKSLQEHLNKYSSKQTKKGATELRKALMRVSKSCKTTRGGVLESVKKMPKKEKKEKIEKQVAPEVASVEPDKPKKVRKPRAKKEVVKEN